MAHSTNWKELFRVFSNFGIFIGVVLVLVAWHGAWNTQSLDGDYSPINQVRMADRAVAELGSDMEKALMMGSRGQGFLVKDDLVYGQDEGQLFAASVKKVFPAFPYCGKMLITDQIMSPFMQKGVFFSYLPALPELDIPAEYRVFDPVKKTYEMNLTEADIQARGLNMQEAKALSAEDFVGLEPVSLMNTGCVTIGITAYIFFIPSFLFLLFYYGSKRLKV